MSSGHRTVPTGLRLGSSNLIASSSAIPGGKAVTRGWYKRGFDLAILFGAHVVLLPLWVMLWTVIPLAILIDGGRPIFYAHPSIGQGGRVFRRLKFRTMISGPATAEAFYTKQNDPRVTRVGRLLRKTAMDELPQVINILRGEMSFVGPRPLGVKMHEHCVRECRQFPVRLRVPPGLTSPAHLFSDPADRLYIKPQRKLAYDRLYIRRMNPLLDVRIVLFSVWRTLRGRWDG